MSHFFFLKATPGELISYMFKDFESQSNVTVLKKILPFSGNINRLVGDVVTRFIDVKPIQWGYSLLHALLNPLKNLPLGPNKNFLIFVNFSAREISCIYLKKYLKHHPNCIPVMLFLDPIDSYLSIYAKRLTEQIPQFLCLTYDQGDAQKYGYHHTMNFYSAHTLENLNFQQDVYFSFSGIDRLEIVQSIANRFQNEHVNANIIIAGEAKHEEYIRANTTGIKFLKSRTSYADILTEISRSNCLLEILKTGYSNSTLRYYEAVCYNKKLLTNNKNVVNFPFYNPNYIKIFEKPEDIDCEWLKKQEPVSYGYDGRFSPISLLDEIVALSQNE